MWVTALRKFLRKGIETVLVSGHFLHQTEEALGLQSQLPPLHLQADSLDRVHMQLSPATRLEVECNIL